MTQDYSLQQVHNLKSALEQQLLQGLNGILSEFTSETGMAVVDLRVEFIDLSTLGGQVHVLPSKVHTALKTPQQLIIGGASGEADKE